MSVAQPKDYAVEAEEGRTAESLLEDPLLKRAFEEVEKTIVDRWKESRTGDVEEQTHLRLMLSALKNVESALIGFIKTGSVAERYLKRERRGLLGLIRR